MKSDRKTEHRRSDAASRRYAVETAIAIAKSRGAWKRSRHESDPAARADDAQREIARDLKD